MSISLGELPLLLTPVPSVALYGAVVEDKDIISVATTSGLALSGLVLVFLGFGVSQLNAVLDTGKLEDFKWRIRYLRAMLIAAVGTVILGVATAGVGMGWLLGSTNVYDVAVVLFFAMLVLTALLALAAVGVVLT